MDEKTQAEAEIAQARMELKDSVLGEINDLMDGTGGETDNASIIPKPGDDEESEDAPEDDSEESEDSDSEDSDEDDEESDDEDEESDSDDDEDEESDDEDADATADSEDDESDDPETQRRIEKIQRAAKRAKEAQLKEVADAKAEFEQLRAQWEPLMRAARDFQDLRERARFDVSGVLLALGLEPERDFDAAARELYNLSKGDKADPAQREAVKRLQRDRRESQELAETRRELQALRDEMRQEREQVAAQKAAAEYMDGVIGAVADSAPTVQTLLENNPKKARAQLERKARELLELGEVPDHSDVVEELEKELSDLLPAEARKALRKKTKSKTSRAKRSKAAKSLSNDLEPSTRPPKDQPISRRELKADVLKGLSRLDAG